MKKITAVLLTIILLLGGVPVQAADIESLANAAILQPLPTGCPELDDEIASILAEIIRPDMSQYQQLKAVYDYCVTSFSYFGSVVAPVCSNGIPSCTQVVEHDTCTLQVMWVHSEDVRALEVAEHPLMSRTHCYYALTMLRDRVGVCDDYTAVFVAMASAVGFEAHFVGGEIRHGDGVYRGHAWAVVRLGEDYFIFDPQAEQYNMRGDSIRYVNFGLSAAGSNYRMRESSLVESVQLREDYLRFF